MLPRGLKIKTNDLIKGIKTVRDSLAILSDLRLIKTNDLIKGIKTMQNCFKFINIICIKTNDLIKGIKTDFGGDDFGSDFGE